MKNQDAVIQFLDSFLEAEQYNDSAINGLQVDSSLFFENETEEVENCDESCDCSNHHHNHSKDADLIEGCFELTPSWYDKCKKGESTDPIEISKEFGDYLHDFSANKVLLTTELFNKKNISKKSENSCRIACSVDSGISVILSAIANRCNLLLTHHGLFWGNQPNVLTGALAKKATLLLGANCSLYSSHLPLDGNQLLGNSMLLARYFRLKEIKPFFNYGGNPIGVIGELAETTNNENLDSLILRSNMITGNYTPKFIAGGSEEIKKVAIVTGSGSSAIPKASISGVDLLITGEAKQEAYHSSLDLEINTLFMGHYQSEILGLIGLSLLLLQRFKLLEQNAEGSGAFFIHHDTMI
jgi:dinuclear metal center YbgI/SA1388 family protein